MKFFAILISFFALHGGPALAEPCLTDAAILTRSVADLGLKVEAIALDGKEFTVSYPTPIPCANGLEFDVNIDQSAARDLLAKPVTGAVLFGKAVLDEGKIKISLSGDSEVLAKISAVLRERGNLSQQITGLTARWWTRYTATGWIAAPFALATIVQSCGRGIHTKMNCDSFRDWDYSTTPQCLRSPAVFERVAGTVRFDDPYVGGENAMVRVWGVASDLCAAKRGRLPWVKAIGDQLLFGTSGEYGRREFTAPVMIEAKGQIQW